MAYTRIYYDDIWEITENAAKKSDEWQQNISDLNTQIKRIIDDANFTGEAADSIKNYMLELHCTLLSIIGCTLQAYSAKARDYYYRYTTEVDSGDGSEFGQRYTTICYSEVNSTDGVIRNNLNNVLTTASQVTEDANKVKNSIAGLVRIQASPKYSGLKTAIDTAIRKATDVHTKAATYESSRVNDFAEIDNLISQALSIINHQLGQARVATDAYQKGGIGSMCDVQNILADLQVVSDHIAALNASGELEAAYILSVSREDIIQQEEEAGREWVRWVEVGVAVVGTVVLIVVTAGGASPVVCATVGAVGGVATAATGAFADNYVETGTLTEGMDWSEFGKDVLIAAVTGAITGYAGAASFGSVIKAPVEIGMEKMAVAITKEGASGLIETVWDVGEAMVDGKPGDEVISVLTEGFVDMTRGIVVKGAAAFVAGGVSGQFGINTSEKGYFQKLGENVMKSGAENLTKGVAGTMWDLGEMYLDPESSKNMQSILVDNSKEALGGFAGDVAGAAVSDAFSAKIGDIDNPVGKVSAESAMDTLGGMAKNVAKGVTERTIDYVAGDETDASKILGDVWEKDLESGRGIVKSAADSLGKNVSDEIFKDKKLEIYLKKHDYDKDGKIDIVQFDEYAVTKEDYNAAVEKAGKGAYKDKTVQDILGLPKDTDLSTAKGRTVSIDMIEKYSSERKTTDTVTIDGKYTYKNDYYEAALNAAGKGEYEGKTAQDILGISNDVDISEGNIERHRVKNGEIGIGKKVELTAESSTSANKLHVSSMKKATRAEREKAKTETAGKE